MLVLLAETKAGQVGPAGVLLVPVPVSTSLSASHAKDLQIGGKAGMEGAPNDLILAYLIANRTAGTGCDNAIRPDMH
jgi:hypothetical protein